MIENRTVTIEGREFPVEPQLELGDAISVVLHAMSGDVERVATLLRPFFGNAESKSEPDVEDVYNLYPLRRSDQGDKRAKATLLLCSLFLHSDWTTKDAADYLNQVARAIAAFVYPEKNPAMVDYYGYFEPELCAEIGIELTEDA